MIFVCGICSTPLGTVNLKELSLPLKPGMFQSLDESRGIPVPFPSILDDWKLMKCRQCKNRPFKTGDHITVLDAKGFRKELDIHKIDIENRTRAANQAIIDSMVDEPEEDTGFKCECGRSYRHESSLIRHKKECNGRK